MAAYTNALHFCSAWSKQAVALLRARRERPRDCRTAQQRHEGTPFHVWMAPAWQRR
jgi:hypothetical protein